MFFGRKRQRKKKPSQQYSPKKYKAVLHCSICNGEQVAGFKELETGKFEELAFIRSEKDLLDFMEQYGLETIEKEY